MDEIIIQNYKKKVDVLLAKGFSYQEIKNWLMLEWKLGCLSVNGFNDVFDYLVEVHVL